MSREWAAVIAERRELLREALERVVSARLKVVASIPSLGEFDRAARSEFSNILLILGCGPQPEIVIQEVRSYREQHRFDRIVVLANAENSDLVISFMRAGADAYIDELISAELLLEALDVVLADGSVVPRGIMVRILSQKNVSTMQALPAEEGSPPKGLNGAPHLSAREAAVLGCLAEGSSNKVIARRFCVAEATVKVHVKTILRKIRVQNRTQAAIWAVNNDIASFSGTKSQPCLMRPRESVVPRGLMVRTLSQKSVSTMQALPAEEASPPNGMNGTPYLSAREAAVLGCLAEGSSNKVIARRFCVAEATVKVHVKTILRKIRVQNRTQAAIWAVNNGIAPFSPAHVIRGHSA
jgi:two-component system, NarL family, nitrate/nitrite response regulator NarL